MNINKFIRENCNKCNKCSHTFKEVKMCDDFIKNTMKIIVNNNQVIAVSSYRGKTVRGIAKCSPEDIFDLSYGTQLAINRCNYKIALKRYEEAIQKSLEAKIKLIIDKASFEEAEKIKEECLDLLKDAEEKLS